jgi:hypothetical protein
MALRIYTVIMLLACIFSSLGWLTTRRHLEAARTVGESLETATKQYASCLKEVNQQAILSNQQVELDNASIAELRQKLDEADKFGTYWWERAHPKEFESVAELKAWLAQDNTDSTFYVFGSGCVSHYDCDDYAVALARNALADGYLVSTQVEGDHMLNSTIIGNDIYFIEPQNDEVWLWGHRD